MKKILLLLASCFTLFYYLPLSADDTDVTGKWLVTDDQTGEKSAIIELYKEGDTLHGKVAKILIPPEFITSDYCAICTDGDATALLGKLMVHDFSAYSAEAEGEELSPDQRKGYWKNGRILDPISGEEYICELWLDDAGNLQVRGFLGPFHRSQTWTKES